MNSSEHNEFDEFLIYNVHQPNESISDVASRDQQRPLRSFVVLTCKTTSQFCCCSTMRHCRTLVSIIIVIIGIQLRDQTLVCVGVELV